MEFTALILGLLLVSGFGDAVPAEQPGGKQSVIVATTTSLQDSGLLDALVPLFEKMTGYRVKTIAVGTGQALAMGRRGDVDLLLVHAPGLERNFMASGHGIERRPFMYNDFIIVGPAEDPAKVAHAGTAAEAFRTIANTAVFLSRGDESGTHSREKEIWAEAGALPKGAWYQQSGQGMGQTLMIASEKDAYSLTDRATYQAMRKGIRLKLLFSGDPKLLNIYSVILVDPGKSSPINLHGARAFRDFLMSPEALAMIERFGAEKYGEPLFYLLTPEKR